METITTERAEELAKNAEDVGTVSKLEWLIELSSVVRALAKERNELLRSVEGYQFALAEIEALELQHGAVVARLQTTIRNLEARDIHSCGPDCQRSGCVNRRLREQLAAAQAVIARKDMLLNEFTKTEPCDCGCPSGTKFITLSPVKALVIAKAALNIQFDDTALREMLAEQLDMAAKVCDKFGEADWHLDDCADALRAEAEKLRKPA